jgi:hypothetical protein
VSEIVESAIWYLNPKSNWHNLVKVNLSARLRDEPSQGVDCVVERQGLIAGCKKDFVSQQPAIPAARGFLFSATAAAA